MFRFFSSLEMQPMPDNTILYSEHDGVHFLRFRGEILHGLAPALDTFLRHLSTTSASQSFLLDLTEASTVDSTMLGLLARIAKLAKAAGSPPPTLICPDEDIVELMIGIGFNEVFSLVESDGEPVNGGQEIAHAEAANPRAHTEAMIDAHQELIALKAENRLLFEDLMEVLQRKLNPPQD
jgi:anti-anti-sigma regulatory factor